MRNLIRRHPVVAYYALAVALAWTYWITLLAMGLRVSPGTSVTHLPGLLAPAIAALAVTVVIGGPAGVRRLALGVFRLPANLPLTAAMIAAPIVVTSAVVIATWALGGAPPQLDKFTLYPGVRSAAGPFLMVVAVIVVNGLGEEVGWRGFAIDRLLAERGPLLATLIVAAMWAAWHLPLFFLVDTMAALVGPTLIGWAIGLLLGAFVLTDVYLRSGRSILAVALWHGAYNLAVAVPGAAGVPAAVTSTLVMIWGVYAAWQFWQHPQNAIRGHANNAPRRRSSAAQ
jgi:membrane protease YdiL (CAAX protease family)